MAERPVECSHCKRPIKVVYKEIIGDRITTTEMCADCPILEQKLHGPTSPIIQAETGIFCGRCHTSMESIITGNPVGCSECYSVFSEQIISDLIAREKLPPQIAEKRSQNLHVGKTPGKTPKIELSSRLASLNEELNEALKRENYEQAAWLRDQIKTLKEKPNE